MRRNFALRALWCAAAALALWLVAAAIAFRTEVRITSDGSQVTWTVDGSTWSVPIALQRVDALSIVAARSAYPMGGETLTVVQGGTTVIHRLPRRFALPRRGLSPTGDWDIDESAFEATVVDLPLEVEAPFEIRAVFTGRCLKFTTLRLRGEPTLDFSFRTGYLNHDATIGSIRGPMAGGTMKIRPWSLAGTALEFLVRAAAFAAAIAAIFQAIAVLRPSRTEVADPLASRGEARRWSSVVVIVPALVFSALSWWVSTRVLERVPHTQDEVAYRLQAKWLTKGQLVGVLPAELTEYMAVPFTMTRDGVWATQYPIGWPLVLALGELVHRAELVNCLLAGVFALLLYAAATQLFGRREALLASALAALSPMALLMFGSYLSHGLAAVLTLLAFVTWLESDRRSNPWLMGCSGAALGYCFGIRPLTAVAVGLVLGSWSLATFLREPRAHRLWGLAAWIGGGSIGALPVLAHNEVVSGSPFVFAYSLVSGVRLSLAHVPQGLHYLDFTLAALGPSLFGWGWPLIEGWIPVSFALGIVVLPFFLPRCGRHEWLLAAIFLYITSSYLLHAAHGAHGYGARFYFEGYFALYLLAARGFVRLADVGEEALAGRRFATGLRITVFACAATLLLSTASTLPKRLQLYRGYNGVSGALDRVVEATGIERGLVLFVDHHRWYNESVPWAEASNVWDGTLESPLMFAVGRSDNAPLLARLSQRPVYRWRNERLVPLAEVGPDGSPDSGAFDLDSARIAGVLDVEANDASFSESLDALFDHDIATLSRTEVANPLVLRLRFAKPVRVAAVKIFPSFSAYDWAVSPRADGPRYEMRAAPADGWSRIDLPEPVETTELHIELRRVERDNHVHLNEVEVLVSE